MVSEMHPESYGYSLLSSYRKVNYYSLCYAIFDADIICIKFKWIKSGQRAAAAVVPE